jgi:tetratricopeptide (TPR) repeat protein
MGKSSRLKKNPQKAEKKASKVLIRKAQKTHHTLGLAMIMKDEIEDLDRIVKDYGKYFDKIYVTVTHKKTYTELLKKFPAINDLVELSYFKWIDHFGKARLYNQSQIKTDYWMWIDLDDEIAGAEKLGQVIEYMDTNSLDAVWFQYDYIRRVNATESGSIQWRERIIKTVSKLEWNDEAIHESIQMQSDTQFKLISESDVMVKHRRTNEQLQESWERNRLILEKEWQQNHRAITAHYQGKDFMKLADYGSAIEKFSFVTEHSENEAIRFDAWESLCECYFQTGSYTTALAAANEGMTINPDHPGPWYERFAVYEAMGDHVAALQSAETAMTKRAEGALANIVGQDPSWYEYRAPFNVARTYLSIGNVQRAYEIYVEVKNIAPEYVEEQSAVTGIQWNAVFEEARNNMLAAD